MIAGSPEVVEAAATDLRRAGEGLVEAGASVARHWSHLASGWSGNASDAAYAVITRLGARTVIGGEDLGDAVPALLDYAAELREAQSLYAHGQAQEQAGQTALGAASLAVGAAAAQGVPDADAERAVGQARDQLAAANHTMTAALERVERANAAAAARIDAVTAALEGWTGTLPAAPPPPPPPVEDDGWSFSDVGHGLLDLGGLIPLAGEPVDGVNALWYLGEGDELNAGLSAGGMVPIGGWFSTGAKVGIKASDEVAAAGTRAAAEAGARSADSARAAHEAAAAARTADEAAALRRAAAGTAGDVARRRVTLRSGVKREIQDNAPKTADGDFIDPNTGQVIPKEGPFHYGHKPGYKWSDTQERARTEGWTRKELIEFENDPSHFQIEDPSSNMSHLYE